MTPIPQRRYCAHPARSVRTFFRRLQACEPKCVANSIVSSETRAVSPVHYAAFRPRGYILLPFSRAGEPLKTAQPRQPDDRLRSMRESRSRIRPEALMPAIHAAGTAPVPR